MIAICFSSFAEYSSGLMLYLGLGEEGEKFSFPLSTSFYLIWTFKKKIVLQILLFLIKHLLLNLLKSIEIISENLLAKVDGPQT